LKTKKKKQNSKISLKILGRILTIIIIMLVSLGSFVGIFKLEQNAMKNIIPDYELGMDLYGARHIVAKVDDTNAEDMLTYDNYIKSKEIIEERLKFLEISDYLVRLDDATGAIDIEIPEDATTDYFVEYTGMQGKFTMTDDETSEVLLDNNSLKKASIQYGTSSAGTTVYLVIEFNKEGSSKLQEVSKTYIKSTDSEGNDTTKKVKMSIDDQTIMTTYFGEEMTDGIMQIPLGTTTNATDIQNYLKQASNISVFLNTEPLPIKYSVDINRKYIKNSNNSISFNICYNVNIYDNQIQSKWNIRSISKCRFLSTITISNKIWKSYTYNNRNCRNCNSNNNWIRNYNASNKTIQQRHRRSNSQQKCKQCNEQLSKNNSTNTNNVSNICINKMGANSKHWYGTILGNITNDSI